MHLTTLLETLRSYIIFSVSECPIGLPERKNAYRTEQGDAYLCANIVLKNFLYAPDLNCNLIAIAHLINDVGCSVHFTKLFCVI